MEDNRLSFCALTSLFRLALSRAQDRLITGNGEFSQCFKHTTILDLCSSRPWIGQHSLDGLEHSCTTRCGLLTFFINKHNILCLSTSFPLYLTIGTPLSLQFWFYSQLEQIGVSWIMMSSVSAVFLVYLVAEYVSVYAMPLEIHPSKFSISATTFFTFC